MQTKLRISEVISLHDGSLRLTTLQRAHLVRHLAILIAQHGPAVDPATRHHGEHTAHTTTILEDDAIPVALLRVDDGTLSFVREASELTFEDDLLLPRTMDIVSTIAHLTAMTTRGIDVRDHQQIVFAVVLDDA